MLIHILLTPLANVLALALMYSLFTTHLEMGFAVVGDMEAILFSLMIIRSNLALPLDPSRKQLLIFLKKHLLLLARCFRQ